MIVLAVGALASNAAVASQPKEKQSSGPYCWAGTHDGKDRFVPCNFKQDEEMRWLRLDLSSFAGLQVLLDGKTEYVTRQEIFTALSER